MACKNSLTELQRAIPLHCNLDQFSETYWAQIRLHSLALSYYRHGLVPTPQCLMSHFKTLDYTLVWPHVRSWESLRSTNMKEPTAGLSRCSASRACMKNPSKSGPDRWTEVRIKITGSWNILQRKNEKFKQWPPEADFKSSEGLLNGSPEQDLTA